MNKCIVRAKYQELQKTTWLAEECFRERNGQTCQLHWLQKLPLGIAMPQVRCSDRHVRGYFAHVQYSSQSLLQMQQGKQCNKVSEPRRRPLRCWILRKTMQSDAKWCKMLWFCPSRFEDTKMVDEAMKKQNEEFMGKDLSWNALSHSLLRAVYGLNMFKQYKPSTLLSSSGVKVQIDYAYMDKAWHRGTFVAVACGPMWHHVARVAQVAFNPKLEAEVLWEGASPVGICGVPLLCRAPPWGPFVCSSPGSEPQPQAPSSRRYRPKSVKPPNGHTPETQYQAIIQSSSDSHMNIIWTIFEGKTWQNMGKAPKIGGYCS